MAERISSGFPFPVYVNESTGKEAIANGVFVNDTTSGGSVTGSVAVTEARDTLVASGSNGGNITGSVAVTEARDTLVASGSAGASLSMTIAEFTAGRIFQRDKGTYTTFSNGTKDVPISGTYTGGAPTGIQATVNGIQYTCTSLSASGGNWSAVIPAVPNGDGYTASVIDTNPASSSSASQTNTWGVGILIALIGQSNMEHMWTTTTGSPGAGDSHARWTKATGWWTTDKGATGTANAGGNGLNSLATKIRADFVAASPGNTTPVGFIGGAVGATYIADWQTGGSAWTTFNTMATNSTVGGDYEIVIWNQGEWDSANGANPGGTPSYATSLANVYSQCQSQTGRTSAQLKFGSALTGSMFSGVINVNNGHVDIVRTAQIGQDALSNCFWANSTVDYPLIPADTLHFAAATYARMGLRYAKAVGKILGSVTYGSDGPKISGAVWTVGTNTITVTVSQLSGGTGLLDGTGSSAGTGLLGFTVTSSGGQTISSTSFSGGNIILTMSANRGPSDTVTLCYAAGGNPWGWVNTSGDNYDHVVYDNQSSYLGDTVGLPLQPTSGGAASPMTVLGGYLITATKGAYTLTGLSAGLLAARKILATGGSYTLTGLAAILTKAIVLTASLGAYAVTGNSANLLAARKILATGGSYTLTGLAATLTKARILLAAAGSHVATGTAAGLLAARKILTAAGSYTLTGNAATLYKIGQYILAAATGAYTLTGNAAGLLKGRILAAATGAYTLTGMAALSSFARRLTAATGSHVVTGLSAILGIKVPFGLTPRYLLKAVARRFSFKSERK